MIRPAAPDDAPACAAILQGWLDATPWMPNLHTLEETEAFVRARLMPHEVWWAEPGGFACVAHGQVAALYVADGARGRGVGAALLDRAKAGRDRLGLWTFRANAGARRFYGRHGFVEGRTTEADNEEGLPDVELTWARV